MSGFLKPRSFGVSPGETPASGQAKYEDESFAKKYPALAEFLQRTVWSENEWRKPGSAILFCEDGVFKAALNDKDGECVAFVSKKTFTGLLEAVEKGLKDDSLDWRLTAAGRQKVRKKG